MAHSALKTGSVAVVTGGAGGIGLAAAQRFAGLGMKVAIADSDAERLAAAAEAIGGAVMA
jgi:NAD(P)-dependent dehydrogenase (short-subunit alcohol dehydrogenase family)